MITADRADPAGLSETRARFLARRELDCADEAFRTHLADEGVIAQAHHALAQVGSKRSHPPDQVFLFNNADVLKRHGTGGGMPRIGIAVIKLAPLLKEFADQVLS